MAQDLGQDFSTGTLQTVSGLGVAIIAGSSDASSEISFDTANAPLGLVIEAIITTGTGTPDGNEQCVIGLRWGASTGNTTDDDNSYHEEVVSIPTASSTFKKTFRTAVLAPYLVFHVKNDQTSGPDITSSYTIKYRVIYGNQQ